MDQSRGRSRYADTSREDMQGREGKSTCRVGQGGLDRKDRWQQRLRDKQCRSMAEGGSWDRGRHRRKGDRTSRER